MAKPFPLTCLAQDALRDGETNFSVRNCRICHLKAAFYESETIVGIFGPMRCRIFGLPPMLVKHEEMRMKLSVPLLALTLCATVVAAPFVPPVNATTSAGKEVKKHYKKPQRGPTISSKAKPSDNPFPPMDQDPDRKAGGGGGY